MNAPAPIVLPDTRGQDRILSAAPAATRRHRWTLWALGGAMALIVGAVFALRAAGLHETAERSTLTIASVERGTFTRDIVASGQVVAAMSPTLNAPAAGLVALEVKGGDAVEKGQRLAVIDSPDLNSTLAQEKALLESLRTDWKRAQLEADRKLSDRRAAFNQAEIDRTTAQREAVRSRKAFEGGAYPELQALRAEDALEKAKFVSEQAQAAYQSQPAQNRFEIDSKRALMDRQQLMVAELQRQVDRLEVRSPVTGRVGQVLIGDHASMTKDAPLLTVVDLSALEVEIPVPESLARDLVAGGNAELTGDGRRWNATVSAVSPQVVNGEVTARLRLADAQHDGLRQSQRLSARIVLDRRQNVLMVDRGLFVEQGGGYVYVVHGNEVERRAVRLGAVSVEKVEILSGLAAGDRIVISGANAFHDAPRGRLTN
jgi:HlyD family secretion protein